MPSPLQLLNQTFGFPAFREGQAAVVDRLLSGDSVLAIFPTGSGKSLCYQLPALLLDGLTVVISPLIALMKDQLDFLASRAIPAARLDSSLTWEENLKVYADLNAGRLKLLYISPERLGNERFLYSLSKWNISLLAVDEAHCISEWGHNFRPDYLKIAHIARKIGISRVLALTATATPPVARAIAAAFAIQPENVVQTGFYRPNLTLRVLPAPGDDNPRRHLLLQRVQSRPLSPTIVYVTLQRTAEQVAEFLLQHDIPCFPYHAGLSTEERTAIQNAFMASDNMIVAATIAFGMGVDKSNIRAVYHYNLPKSLESYAQEIGRAGRDGQPSLCEILASTSDVVRLENFTFGDTPTPEAIASLLREILSQGLDFELDIHELSQVHDVRPLVVKTLLSYLELEGVLESTGSLFRLHQFQPQRPSAEIFARFDPERVAFLRGIFTHAKKGRIWFTLDAHQVSRDIGQPRERIVAALEYLAQKGDLILKSSEVRERYRLLTPPLDRQALWQTFCTRFARREELEIGRIRKVLEFTRLGGCRTRFLLAHFGEERPPCGHCDQCQTPRATDIPNLYLWEFGKKEAEVVNNLAAEGHPSLASPRQMARFLCGLASPATTRARLKSHSSHALWADTPFLRVLSFVETTLS